MFCNHYQPEAGSRHWNDSEGCAHLGDCLKCHLLAAVPEWLHVRAFAFSFHTARQHFWTHQPGKFSCMVLTQWQAPRTFRLKLFLLEAVSGILHAFLNTALKARFEQWPGYWLDVTRIVVRFPARARNFFLSKASRPTLGPSQAPVQGASSICCRRVKR